MQKKIFEFFGNLQSQAESGTFEEEKLEEPIVILEKERPAKEVVMEKKEEKIQDLQAKVPEVKQEVYEDAKKAHAETKQKSQKTKEQLKRENLEELAGIPLVDPQKVDELESLVKNIPKIDPKRVS